MSDYVKLMEVRKIALWEGDEETAEKCLDLAEALVAAGKVAPDEFIAGAYI